MRIGGRGTADTTFVQGTQHFHERVWVNTALWESGSVYPPLERDTHSVSSVNTVFSCGTWMEQLCFAVFLDVFLDVFFTSFGIFCCRDEAGLAAGERLWKRGKVTTEDLVGGRVMTSGKTSGSFTSSSLTVSAGGGGFWLRL